MSNIFIKQLFILVLCVSHLNLFAQTKQQGVVQILNSNQQKLAGVEITFYGAKSVRSDKNGDFELDFKDKKYGDVIVYDKIHKEGYEIVNLKEVEVSKLEKEKLKIILCPSGEIAKNKSNYFNISVKAIMAGYQRKINQLKKQFDKGKISKDILSLKQNELFNEKENTLEYADKLAEQFARTNFDDVSNSYKKAFGQFKKGEIEKSIEILEAANQNSKRENKMNGEDIWTMKLSAQMYMMTSQYQKADEMYYALWKLDTMNVQNITNYADFLSDRNQYEKSILFYNKLLKLDIADWLEGDVYRKVGYLYQKTGKLPQAFKYYQKYNEMYEKKYKIERHNTFYNKHLSLSYNTLGMIYQEQGDFEKAKRFYLQSNELLEEICKKHPQNIEFKNTLGGAYESLGYLYLAEGNFKMAEKFLLLDFNVAKEIYEKNPENEDYKENMTISYASIGLVYDEQEKYHKAKEYYTFANKLSNELYQSNPKNEEVKALLAESYSSLAGVYQTEGDFDEAEKLLNTGITLNKELYQSSPQDERIKSGLGLAYALLGSNYLNKDVLSKAEEFLLLGTSLLKELYETNPQSERFKISFGFFEQALAGIYLEQQRFEEAKIIFVRGVSLFEDLYKNNSQNYRSYMGVGLSYMQLGVVYNELEKNDIGIDYYKKSYTIFEELFQITQNQYYRTLSDALKIEIENSGSTKAEQIILELGRIEELKNKEQTKEVKTDISLRYGNLSWHYLFEKQFVEAEKAALTALEYDDSQQWVKTNIIHSFLFRDQYKKAKEMYLEMKDKRFTFDFQYKNYGEVFLADFKELEKTGVTHKDVEKIRKLLK